MKRNLTFAAIGILVGLVCGFKAANYGLRRDLEATRNATALQAASDPRVASVNSSSSQDSTPPSAARMQQQTDAIIARARNNPADFEAQQAAAEQFMQIQRPEGALEFLRAALKLKPEDPETLAAIGEANFFLQQFDESILWTRRALKVRPDYPLAQFYLMFSLIEKRERLDEAERLLASLEQLRPGDPALAQVRQRLLDAKGGAAPSGKSKTVLSHGPEEPAGGRR
jgi:tetratricopeptide (TPR) repeat protein